MNEPEVSRDSSSRGDSVSARLCLVGLFFLACCGLLFFLPPADARFFAKILLAVLAVLGTVFVFAFATGFVRLGRAFERTDAPTLSGEPRAKGLENKSLEKEDAFQNLQYAIDYLDHAPMGFWSADDSGNLLYVNGTLASWLGIDLGAFRAGSLNLADIVRESDRGALEDARARLFKEDTERAADANRICVFDAELAGADGASVPVRLHTMIAADNAPGSERTIVLNRASAPRLAQGAQKGAQKSEYGLEEFLRACPIAVATVSADGLVRQSNGLFSRLFDVNAAKGGQGERGEREGEAAFWERLCAESEQSALRAALERVIAGESETEFVESVLPDSEDRHIRFFLSGLALKEKEGRGALVYVLEMSERKALERHIAQGEKMQAVGQLAGGIAHDFNNVLTAIIGLSDLLLSNHRPYDPSFPDIMGIKNNANRAASLVRQLLAFSRRQTLNPQVLSISDILSDLRLLLTRLLGDQVSLSIRHGRDLWPVKLDMGEFERVIVNLCVNGRDAVLSAAKSGSVTIETRNQSAQEQAAQEQAAQRPAQGQSEREYPPAGDYVLIEVKDTGSGMSQEVMRQIFEPFFSTKKTGEGTGLGLATVYGIVKQSGGFIYVDSAPDEGTGFRLYFPRHIADAAESADSADSAETAGARKERKEQKEPVRALSGSGTIIFAEDEDSVRAVGSRTLQARGYRVHEAENGLEALRLLEEHGDGIDLIVSDVVMPEMDGPTLLQKARASGSDVPFIFASGYAQDAFDKNLDQAAEFDFIAKPYDLKELALAVKGALERRGTRRAHPSA